MDKRRIDSVAHIVTFPIGNMGDQTLWLAKNGEDRFHNVNIAFMKLYRDNKGENAYTIIETDEKLDERLVDEIQANPNIKSAIVIEL